MFDAREPPLQAVKTRISGIERERACVSCLFRQAEWTTESAFPRISREGAARAESHWNGLQGISGRFTRRNQKSYTILHYYIHLRRNAGKRCLEHLGRFPIVTFG